MKKIRRYFVYTFFVSYLLSINLSYYCVDLPNFYQNKLQTNFFSGFLALGGFLLSLKTFIIVKLHEGIFQNKTYRERFEAKYEFMKEKPGFYAPLINLSDFLVWSVGLSLVTATCQITLGFVPSRWVISICLALAVVSIALVFTAWWSIKNNLSEWFILLQQEYDENTNQGQNGE